MPSLFVSDLHLSHARPELTQLFLDFLRWAAKSKPTLYILGDLFDAWIGDDAPDPTILPVLAELKNFSSLGHDIFIMHGNRDFLLGETFLHATGARLLEDPSIIELLGKDVLLCHGDTLCVDDVAYQQFRRQVRDPNFIQEFLSKSIQERIEIAKQLRLKSQQEIAGKTEIIMDVNQDAVVQLMQQHGVTRLIHGHTHRLAVHRLDLDHGPAQRFVLGDWSERTGNFLHADDEQIRLLSYPQLQPLS